MRASSSSLCPGVWWAMMAASGETLCAELAVARAATATIATAATARRKRAIHGSRIATAPTTAQTHRAKLHDEPCIELFVVAVADDACPNEQQSHRQRRQTVGPVPDAHAESFDRLRFADKGPNSETGRQK